MPPYLNDRFGPEIGGKLRQLLNENDNVFLVGSAALQIVLGEVWHEDPVTIACAPGMREAVRLPIDQESPGEINIPAVIEKVHQEWVGVSVVGVGGVHLGLEG